MLANTVASLTVGARGWRQINGILRKYAPDTTQGYVRIRKISGNNPFLAYGVINDGGTPGERSGDGAYLPAMEERIQDPGTEAMTDREVLEAFYHETDGPNWKAHTNWLTDAPLSEWYGVETNGSGRVTRLSLHNNGLSGTISPKLGRLTRLQELNLGGNRLSGSIPPELGGLTQIQGLHLWGNQLSGAIPPVLGQLTQLQWLQLAANQLSGPIPPELGGLNQLQWLILQKNKLNGAIPPELGGLTHLQEVNLGHNQLSGPIPPELGRLSRLGRMLDLGGNRLSGGIPPELGQLTHLQWLGLWGNRLTGAIPKDLQQLSKLKRLDLLDTQVCVPADPAFQAWLDTIVTYRPSGLVCDGTRRILFLASSYEVREGESVTVSVRLIDQTGDALRSAEIALTATTRGGASAADYSGVPESVTIMAPSTEVSFVATAVEDDHTDHGETVVLGFRHPLPSGITAGDPDMARVRIIDPGTEAMTDREVLEALYHATHGPNWSNHTNWLSDLPLSEWYGVETNGSGRVTRLSLQNNQLSGTIPPGLGQLTQLEALDLVRNQLSGPIPPGLSSLTNLQELWLAFNQLSGAIPHELGQLTHLRTLFLRDNRLSGTIPIELSQLGQLQELTVSNNQLSGAIPPGLDGLTQLRVLSLGRNQLSGTIPPGLGGLLNLEGLSLRANQLSGAIPPELGQLTQLEALELGGNQLSGAIPPELGELTQLRALDLGRNQLSGAIPSGLGGLLNLARLRLWANQLSASIPPGLGRLAQLRDLSLGDNQLSGAIPPELGELTQLQQLSLGVNQLSGTIPPELGQLGRLQELTVRGNLLTGAIPPELARLTQLQRLDLSFNSDVGGMILPTFQQLPLTTLDLMATSVCVPEDLEFQAWLATIEFTSSGLVCGRPAAAMSEIDIAVFYTPAARRIAGGTAEMEAMIDLKIADTNQVYVNSGVNQRLFLVAREEVEYTESESPFKDINRLVSTSDGQMDEVHAIRDRAGADLVHLIADRAGGVANLAGAFGVSCATCNFRIFAHELGHNMGLLHDRHDTPRSNSFPYNHGYVNQRAFADGAPASVRWLTIMAVGTQCGNAGVSCSGILRFSNPNQTHLGDPLGVPGEERTTGVNGPADAVRTLNLTRHSVASFRPRASGNRLALSSTSSQVRSTVRNSRAWPAVLAPGEGIFRAITPSGGRAGSGQAGDALDRATLRRRVVSVGHQEVGAAAGGETHGP